ncbi:innexin inx1-like [Artemia franciscana]|uniref:Innexin n=1 Tax=Artemia franciscana TaxID=6661 RepID=A0AA88LE40_ARTSF|nr:hypothetical protein QYM36_007847 [Artemia franciscana]
MYNLLAGLRIYFKKQEIKYESGIFRLSYMFTTAILIAASLMTTAVQYIGTPITCMNDGDVPINVINTYCWISSTFTMPDSFNRKIGGEVAHPGLGNENGERKYHAYYQWVCFVLFFQALFCYIPKWLWKSWEGNLMATLVMGMNSGLKTEEEKEEKKRVLIDYLLGHVKQHTSYALRYFICETLAWVNVMVQMYVMNRFLGGQFFSYGVYVTSYADEDQESRSDPMIYVFPRVTKCTFHKYGSSGTITRHDALCVLPQNIINEKTYIFLWFWFIILWFLLTGLVIYRAALLVWPRTRPKMLRARARYIPGEVIDVLSRKTDLGDWWILYNLGRNLEPLVYREVVSELAKKVETAASNAV